MTENTPEERFARDEFPWSYRQVSGALRSCIHDHGPITKKSAPSAAKRIVNQLYGASAPTQVVEKIEASERKLAELEARCEQLTEALRKISAHAEEHYDGFYKEVANSALTGESLRCMSRTFIAEDETVRCCLEDGHRGEHDWHGYVGRGMRRT